MLEKLDQNEADTKIAYIENNTKFELNDGADHAFR
jgi:hypothetical protein